MAVQGGFGVELKITVAASLTTVAHVLEVEYPEFEKILAEATAHDSPGGYAEHVATGKKQLNEFTVTLAWDKAHATHAALLTAFNANAPVEMSIEDPGGTEVITFDAHVRTVSRIAEQDDVYKAEVAIQPTGEPTITAGS